MTPVTIKQHKLMAKDAGSVGVRHSGSTPRTKQQWNPSQKELNKIAKDCTKSLKQRIKTGDTGGWTSLD